MPVYLDAVEGHIPADRSVHPGDLILVDGVDGYTVTAVRATNVDAAGPRTAARVSLDRVTLVGPAFSPEAYAAADVDELVELAERALWAAVRAAGGDADDYQQRKVEAPDEEDPPDR